MTDTIEKRYTDVIELSKIFQCLGFSVKLFNVNDEISSQDGESDLKTIDIQCYASGTRILLESVGQPCSCPLYNPENSGFWHVSGVAGGKQLDQQEYGYSVLGSLSKSDSERLSKELFEIVSYIKRKILSDSKDKNIVTNISNSMVDLKTPEKIDRLLAIKKVTPTRYRSLDTLTKAIRNVSDADLPTMKALHKVRIDSDRTADEDTFDKKHSMCQRQGTYTVASTPGSIRGRSKTSSPIHASRTNFLDDLLSAEKSANELSMKLNRIVREYTEGNKNDSIASWPGLDVSKITVLKGAEPFPVDFASNPNLPSLIVTSEELKNTKLNRYESASASNLATDKSDTEKRGKISRLRRFSPNFLRLGHSSKEVRSTIQGNDTKKLPGSVKPKIITPVQVTKSYTKSSPNLNSSGKNKFSHVKSTIPKPTKK